ncbi:MAG: DUF1801 domain-containing protein [Polyangiaceae bacterium]
MARAQEVETWFASYDNPMKPVVLAMRELILAADPRIGECIKWKSPTFEYRGNLASFNPRSKAHASLMFHTGAQIPGTFPSLEGTGEMARFLKVDSLEAIDGIRAELETIVRAWCNSRDGATDADAPAKKAPAKKAPAKKAPAKKAPAKKAPAKKAPAKKAPAKKAPPKKAPPKKAPPKAPGKKQTPVKAPGKKQAPMKAPGKKQAPMKAPGKQPRPAKVAKQASARRA